MADALRAVNSDPTFRSDFTLAALDGKRIARYTLASISNHLARQSSATGAEQIANPDAKEVNLEHVFPESNPASWRSAFSSGANPADYIYRIGNLTLLRTKVNRDGQINHLPKSARLLWMVLASRLTSSFAASRAGVIKKLTSDRTPSQRPRLRSGNYEGYAWAR